MGAARTQRLSLGFFCSHLLYLQMYVVNSPPPFFLRASSCQQMSNRLSPDLLGSVWRGQSLRKHVCSLAVQPPTIRVFRSSPYLSMYPSQCLAFLGRNGDYTLKYAAPNMVNVLSMAKKGLSQWHNLTVSCTKNKPQLSRLIRLFWAEKVWRLRCIH